MKPVSWILAAALALGGATAGQSPSPGGLPVTYERLLKAAEEPGNWLMYSGDYRSHHYSSLNQITVANVARLRAKWIYQMHRAKVETTPIVVDGRMYVTRPPSDVIALDAETGRALWTYEYRLSSPVYTCCGEVNRGLAILGTTHLRALSGIPRSFLKSELKEIKLTGASLMPAYPSISKEELENLVAYLSSLRTKRTGGAVAREPVETVVWIFDRLENIGGHSTTVLGQPRVIDSPIGKAVEFDGVDDALFIDHHPLAGAERFTWEAIFRPDGGATEQRWFHLSEQDPATGADTDNRMLFEIRVAGDRWFFDSYNQSGGASKALLNRKALHPLGAWYHVASVYDGEEFRNYVDGVQEGAARLHLAPHGPGHASVGVRINKTFYFKGAVRLARFTRSALSPAEFVRAPAKP